MTEITITQQRWIGLCQALSIIPDSDEYQRLAAVYNEPQRAYHTQQHLSECLAQLDWAKSHQDIVLTQHDAALVEMALWYHDAVYQPRAHNNEQKSADWAVCFLTQAGIDADQCQSVYDMIMATCHDAAPEAFLQQLVVDIDLSILGAARQRFTEYDKQVRREYRWVPWFLYKRKRKQILQYFLDQSRIYNTDVFYAKYEHRARENLVNSIRNLQ